MGSGIWSTDVYDAADRYRAATGASAFAYSDSGARTVHDELDPHGVTIRESRDSAEHPSRADRGALRRHRLDGRGAPRAPDQAAAAARPAAAQGLRHATRRSCSARSATPPATGCRCRSASSSPTTGWTRTSAGSCWRAAAAGR